jgi:hypothetical protein
MNSRYWSSCGISACLTNSRNEDSTPWREIISGSKYSRTHPSAGFSLDVLSPDFSGLSRDFGVGVTGENCVFAADRAGIVAVVDEVGARL